jgi:hypothetical protein
MSVENSLMVWMRLVSRHHAKLDGDMIGSGF